MLVSAASNVLYTYYVSRLGAQALAAVSLVFPVALVAVTAMGGGIGSGVSSAIARALGAERRAEAGRLAEQGLSLAIALGIAFGGLVMLGARPYFHALGGRGAVLDGATIFARVLFGGATITFVGGMFDSILRGEGNVRVPAVWSTVSIGLQIVLTPVFMFVAGWGLVGAAAATLAAQLLASLARARYVFGGRAVLRMRPRLHALRREPVSEILRVGVPASLSTMLSQVGIMVLTGVLGHLGQAHLAAYGLGTRLDFLLLSFAYGFGMAVLTLVGLAIGAGEPRLVSAYMLRSALIVAALLAIPGVLLSLDPTLWVRWFSTDPDILAVGAEYSRWIAPSYPFLAVGMVISFAFQGLGHATAPLVWMVTRTIVVLAIAIVCTQVLGMADRAVFVTVGAANTLSPFVMTALFLRMWRRRLRAQSV